MPAVRRSDWDALSPFERNCAFWTESHRLARKVETHPHYRRVRMEDLHDVGLLRELFDFFDLPQPDRWRLVRASRTEVNKKRPIKRSVMAAKADALPPYDRWPSTNQQRLRDICGETAAALGYVA
jgi:hypothetical protein